MIDLEKEPARQAAEHGVAAARRRYWRQTVASVLLLVALGVYSVTPYAVARHEREHGIRLALGASTGALARTVLSGALRPAAAGVAVGLLVAWAGARTLSGFLYGVDARDRLALAGAAALLVLVTALAAIAPARRAARADPTSLLRAE